MSNIIPFPVVAGVEITTDEQGRFNLKTLQDAAIKSGVTKDIRPNEWMALQSTKELTDFLITEYPAFDPVVSKPGRYGGTFVHELLAIEYAGWISPKFRLLVNQTFIDYKSGKLAPAVEMSRLEILQMAMESEKERVRLEAENLIMLPKAAFHDKVIRAPDTITVAEAAKIIGTGRGRLFAFLREHSWVTRKNEPYQEKINAGLMDVKLGNWEHPEHGIQQAVTAMITGKGLAKLQQLFAQRASA